MERSLTNEEVDDLQVNLRELLVNDGYEPSHTFFISYKSYMSPLNRSSLRLRRTSGAACDDLLKASSISL